MNLNGKYNILLNKVKISSNKNLLNINRDKLQNLILSKKPLSLLCSLKRNTSGFVNKNQMSCKKLSLKNCCLKGAKMELINKVNNIKKLQVQNFSNYKNSKKGVILNRKEINTSCNNLKNKCDNKISHILNKVSNEIPSDTFSYNKKQKYFIKKQRSSSIKKLKYKNTKSYSISRNLYMSGRYSFIKLSNKYPENHRINYSFNGNIRPKNKYLISNKKKYDFESKCKMNFYRIEQKVKKLRKVLKSSNSRKNLNNAEKNITYGNIPTNNSDKENTDFSTKKNNLTTHSNNIPYFTTNFNNSTNITETNNNELTNENKICKQKKIIKKKLSLPIHPNSKKEELYKQIETKNKSLMKNRNKSDVIIPYNKKNNKSFRIIKNNSPSSYFYGIKDKKFDIHYTLKNKNNSFFDIYNNNVDNDQSNNFFDSFDSYNEENKFCDLNKNNLLCLENEKLEKDDLFGVEMAHFRIVSIIQENKKLLNYKDK